MPKTTVDYIEQKDLLAALRLTDFRDERGIRDFPPELEATMDPEAWMLVSLAFPHNDTADFRVMAYALEKGKSLRDPTLVVFTLPARFNRLLQKTVVEVP